MPCENDLSFNYFLQAEELQDEAPKYCYQARDGEVKTNLFISEPFRYLHNVKLFPDGVFCQYLLDDK
jgi:hypothetical protein